MARTSDKATYWAEIIRRYRRSDLTQAQFCREIDISFHSLRWWLHQPRAKRAIEAILDEADHKARPKPKAPSVPQAARFLPVRIADGAAGLEPSHEPLGLSPSIQVLLAGGLRVAVGPGFDPDVLRRVVVALESHGC